MSELPFTQLKLPTVNYTKLNKHFYRLWEDSTKFTDIEAESASEAVEKSGIIPTKIEHILHYLDGTLKEESLTYNDKNSDGNLDNNVKE